MLFFRSEESLKAWTESRGTSPNPTATVAQLWELAVAWYGNRLSDEARRPGPDEAQAIFSRVGLTDPFWNLAG